MYTYYIVARLLRAFALFSGVEIYSHTAIIRFGVGRDDSDTSEIIPPASRHGHGQGDRRIRLRKNILARAIKEARLGVVSNQYQESLVVFVSSLRSSVLEFREVEVSALSDWV